MALVEGVDSGEGRLAEEALSYRQSAFGEIRPMAHPPQDTSRTQSTQARATSRVTAFSCWPPTGLNDACMTQGKSAIDYGQGTFGYDDDANPRYANDSVQSSRQSCANAK